VTRHNIILIYPEDYKEVSSLQVIQWEYCVHFRLQRACQVLLHLILLISDGKSRSSFAFSPLLDTHTHTHIYIYICTECPRRNLPYFGTVFLMLKYTDITQNTYVQSWTVTEIMAREKGGLLSVPRTVRLSWLGLSVCPWLWTPIAVSSIFTVFVAAVVQSAMLSQCVTYSAWISKDSYDMACEFFVVRFNGFMSLTS
jgi:hypothetical protein